MTQQTDRPAQRAYLCALVQAWAQRRSGSVAMPPHVDAPGIWKQLVDHNVVAALGPLLPVDRRPVDYAERLAAAHARTANLLLECERLAPALNLASDRCVLLKGAALALTHYRDPAQRWFLDLDVLVDRKEADRVCRALHDLGYRPLRGVPDPLFYERHHFHRILLGPSGACVEVHWALTLPGSVYRHPPAGVRGRAVHARLGRHALWAASPADQVLHAVYQNIADGFLDLRRVLDLALILPSFTEADWAELLRLAGAAGLSRALAFTLHVVKQIAEIPLPPGVLQGLDVGPTAWRTARGLDLAAGCLDRRALTQGEYASLLHLVAVPQASSRWREIGRLLWPGESAHLEQGHSSVAPAGFGWRLRYGARKLGLLTRVGWLAARAYARG